MKKREIPTSIIIILLAAALALTAAACGQAPAPEPAEPTEPPREQPPAPAQLTLADDARHPALMSLMEDGLFHPGDPADRETAFGAIGNMVESLVAEDSAGGVEALTADGVLVMEPGAETGDLGRGELSAVLTVLAGQMAGADADRVHALAADVTAGTYAGNEDVPETVSRAELAQVLEALAGRTPDGDALFFRGKLPPDVTRGDAGWEAIADAVTRGNPRPVKAGLYRLYGWLYAAGDDGSPTADTVNGLWTFGPDGAYTTGNSALDGYLKDALEASGANELRGQAALKAAYLWVKDNFEYMVTPEDMTPEEVGSTGWEFERAARFFENGGGTCYGYAAAFGLLARCLGETAHIVAAEVNQYNGDHSFVVIPEEGVDWIYDVELEDARPERHADLDLFRIENYVIYNYWYTPAW